MVKDTQSCEEDESASPEDVAFPKVETPCLEKVVEFLKHYETEPMTEITTPLVENTFDGVVKQEWYREFIKGLDQSMLFDLVTTANYMTIREWNPLLWNFVLCASSRTCSFSSISVSAEPLLDLTCLKVSCTLMGKTAEEIRVILNIPKLTPEEEARARQEHRWIFDN